MPRATRRRRLGALLGALVALGLARPAAAWNAAGHMQIALLAYDELPEDTRARLATLLEAHPRWHEDFLPALPAGLATQAERARWSFAYAATWPDVARGQPAYEHGTWHYVNLPLELRGSALASCKQARRELPASERRIAAIHAERRARGEPGIPAGDSILRALPDNQRTLADASAPREARALALSWVLHLVGDAHQPLHAVALFTGGRFITGDRGGNDIMLRERGSLHRVWDGLLGDEATPRALKAALVELRADRALWRVARLEAAQTSPAAWIDEDCDLARSAVYVPAVLSAVRRFEHEPPASPAAAGDGVAPPPAKPELALRAAYYQHAAQKARQRAVQAALRLAAALRSLSIE